MLFRNTLKFTQVALGLVPEILDAVIDLAARFNEPKTGALPVVPRSSAAVKSPSRAMVSKTRLALPRCCTARSKKVG